MTGEDRIILYHCDTVVHHRYTEMQPHGVIMLLSLVLKINSLKVTIINRSGTLPYHVRSLSRRGSIWCSQ